MFISHIARCAPAIVALVAAVLFSSLALAWGPHPQIGAAALEVIDALPQGAQWRDKLGGEANYRLLSPYSTIGDHAGTETGRFFVNDYVWVRGMKNGFQHWPPYLLEVYPLQFRRCLTALRTDTPVNAIRQLGPLLHYVQDTGAPNHYGDIPKMSVFVSEFTKREMKRGGPTRIHIPGYEPQLLGKNDEEATLAFQKRMESLWAYTKEKCEQAGKLPKTDVALPPEADALILDAALESSRACADLLYTLFTLGLSEQPAGAGLEGVVTAPAIFGNNALGARVILLDAQAYEALSPDAKKGGDVAAATTDYVTLAETTAQSQDDGWQGEVKLRNLPPGTYHLLGIRPCANWIISDAITLEAGKVTPLRLALPPASPAGNMLPNPTARLRYLHPEGMPDRWGFTSMVGFKIDGRPQKVWVLHRAKLARGKYRFGAMLKDAEARVRFQFRGVEEPILLPAGQQPPEQEITIEKESFVQVTVESKRPVGDVLGNAWVVPLTSAP